MTPPTRSRITTSVILALSILAGLLLGPVAGGAAAALTAVEPRGPSGPPPVTAAFPTEANIYLPAVTVGLIAKDFLERAKWKCHAVTPNSLVEPARRQTQCTSRINPADLRVSIKHDDDTKVRSVHAYCHLPPGAQICHTLFRAIADLSLTGQPDLRKRAAAWATDNADRDTTTVIGAVRIVIGLRPHAIDVFPAD